jgi:biopolymer transport protein ExbD
MAISMGPSTSGDEDELLASINTTPLVDVMLVLLIIFLITVPVVTHTVPVSLPRETNQPTQTTPRDINISVDKSGVIYWNQVKLPDLAALQAKVQTVSGEVPQPEVHIWGDQNAHYQSVGEVLLACQRAGIQKVGFITQPASPDSSN